jgi:hypothetical protein
MVSQDPATSRVSDAIDRLTNEYRGMLSAEMIRTLVTTSFESYRGSRIVDFVPLLVYKSARDQLVTLARRSNPAGSADYIH